jgi:hypothetical protein
MSFPRTLLALCLVSLLSLVSFSTAHAQARDPAREHYEAGQAHVFAGRYNEAYAAFSAGFEVSGRAGFLFNMAECALHAGDPDRARLDYARYLAQAPSGAISETARVRLSELGPAPAVERAPAVPTPAAVAANVLRLEADRAPVPPAREIWEEEAFWIVAGTVLALAIGGAITGGVLASGTSGPACSAGCAALDFR